MLDIGWAELLVVGVVALLVVGPKELPGMLRTLGTYIGIVRRQANEFKEQFNDAIKDTELDEIRKEVDAIRNDTAATIRDVQSSVSIRDSDIGPATTTGSDDDPTWMTGDDQPSPAETAANAAAERAVAMRNGGATKADPGAGQPQSGDAGGAPAASATTGTSTRSQAADAGA